MKGLENSTSLGRNHLFLLKLDVHIPDQMVSQIVADVHLLHLSILVLALHEDVLEEVIIVLLHLFVGHVGQMRAISSLGRVLGVDVEVGEEDRLGEGWLVVDPAAPVSVSAGPCASC